MEHSLHIFVGVLGALLVFLTLLDTFESVILPRRVTREFRIARLFTRSMWRVWVPVSRRIRSAKTRETYLSYYGPLALLGLFALWAWMLVMAFAMMQWGAGSAISAPANGGHGFGTDFYMSGTTFFTLGLGDVLPQSSLARALAVLEAGLGFGFLAVVISYLPTFYNAFSQREVNISLLDARAGSPPTAGELLRRHGSQRIPDGLGQYLREWEIWAAQLMESHLTYPVLCFFRSQHGNQSWIAALTAILDMCSLLIAYGEGEAKRQAQLTFTICRHALADLSDVLNIQPRAPHPDRLSAGEMALVRCLLLECGVPLSTEAGDSKLKELRGLYEPIANGLSLALQMPLPSWGAQPTANRPNSIWARVTSETAAPPEARAGEDSHH